MQNTIYEYGSIARNRVETETGYTATSVQSKQTNNGYRYRVLQDTMKWGDKLTSKEIGTNLTREQMLLVWERATGKAKLV